MGCGAAKVENFMQFQNINARNGVSLGQLLRNFQLYGWLHVRLTIKIWMDLLEGFLNYGGLKLGVYSNHIFSTLNVKHVCQMPKTL